MKGWKVGKFDLRFAKAGEGDGGAEAGRERKKCVTLRKEGRKEGRKEEGKKGVKEE